MHNPPSLLGYRHWSRSASGAPRPAGPNYVRKTRRPSPPPLASHKERSGGNTATDCDAAAQAPSKGMDLPDVVRGRLRRPPETPPGPTPYLEPTVAFPGTAPDRGALIQDLPPAPPRRTWWGQSHRITRTKRLRRMICRNCALGAD